MASDLPTYNLKAVIRETGLTPATLRAWERRYGFLKPHRSAGGHRLYTQNEIELLKWLVARQAEGLSISHAVHLWRNQEQNGKTLAPLTRTTSYPASPAIPTLDALRQSWINACTAFNEPAAEQILAQAFAIAPPEIVCIEILQKGLAEIGAGWYAGQVTIQQEHFASSLAMRRLHALFAASPLPSRPGRILAACPPGEIHEFSLLLLSYLLRRRGWEVVYLGVNVPFSHFDDTIHRVSPRLVISVAQTLSSAAELKEMASIALAQGVPLAYGGGIFNHIPALRDLLPGYFLGDTLENVPQLVESLFIQPPGHLHSQALPPNPELHSLLHDFNEHTPHILAAVTAALQSEHINPAHLEEANYNFTRYLIASLKLGSLQILDYTVSWLEGLLGNYGLPPTLAGLYLVAYRQALQQQLGSRAAPLLEWLARFDPAS
jgi:DNA-binding transcriptional MerR regulator